MLRTRHLLGEVPQALRGASAAPEIVSRGAASPSPLSACRSGGLLWCQACMFPIVRFCMNKIFRLFFFFFFFQLPPCQDDGQWEAPECAERKPMWWIFTVTVAIIGSCRSARVTRRKEIQDVEKNPCA